MVYFFARYIGLGSLGGHPIRDKRVKNFGKVGDWAVYKSEDPEVLEQFKGFSVVPISEKAAEGVHLLHMDKASLSGDDLKKYKASKRAIKKLRIRSDISKEVGDLEDQVADLGKRVKVLELAIYCLVTNQASKADIDEYFSEFGDKFNTRSGIDATLAQKQIARQNKIDEISSEE